MKISKTDLKRLLRITDKRPATVIKHILEHGSISTEELEKIYGYKHPPRAVRDVRERGVNVETFKIKSSDGHIIGAYRFGNPIFIENKISKAAGRTALSSALRSALIERYGARCFVYNQEVEERILQVDHRIPFEIGGEPQEDNLESFMLLCPSANRAKSWSCEHCTNWREKDVKVCATCFWAEPENYSHIACKPEKHIVITFTGNEIKDYESLIQVVGAKEAEDTIKKLIKDFLQKNESK
ncbi:MAG: HNH endonuclease [Muribaculaceae bacterium]|nr:HNH endonuclease [Muribaculaceae bacterium]